jgi:tripartite-type tricarboxylate transporter receptor subunit TctC
MSSIMKWIDRLLAVSIGGLTFALATSGIAMAQPADYPTRPIHFIVSYPPGGPADILARQLAQELSVRLGASVVIENRGGANGNIGAAIAARAQPDGHTLFMMTSSHTANMTLYAKPGYDVLRDFVHISNIASYPLLLVVHPSVKAASVRELVALARTSAGKLTFASAGSGGGAHLAAELFKTMAAIDMLHVPYKGTGPALQAVVGGEVNLMFAGVSAATPHVSSGKLRALGVSSATRLKVIPDVPTVAESGVPGYELTSWLGVSAPAGTPAAIVDKLNAEIREVVQSPKFSARLEQDGAQPRISSAQEFVRFIQTEVGKWAKLIRASGAETQ